MRRRKVALVCLIGMALSGWHLLTRVQAQTAAGPLQTCSVVNDSTTTLVAFTGVGCVKNDGQTAFYITDIQAGASAASTVTTDVQLQLKYGTGTNCGTGTTVLWNSYNLAFQPVVQQFKTPLKVPGGKDLCWMDAVTGSKTFIVMGYLGAQ